MELDNCRIDNVLRRTIRDFVWDRHSDVKGLERAIKFCGRQKDYEEADAMADHYFEIIRLKLGDEWRLLDDYTSYLNTTYDVKLDAEYMRGVMDAFAVFRTLLAEDDRRRAAC